VQGLQEIFQAPLSYPSEAPKASISTCLKIVITLVIAIPAAVLGFLIAGLGGLALSVGIGPTLTVAGLSSLIKINPFYSLTDLRVASEEELQDLVTFYNNLRLPDRPLFEETLKDRVEALPDSIENLEALTYLNLKHNPLQDRPAQIGQLQRMHGEDIYQKPNA
jgi:hypothetical protein